MGFLERAIRRGISDAVGKVVGDTVRQAVEPAATDLVNQAANAMDQTAQNAEQQVIRASGLGSAMASLERSAQGYVTEAAKNMKICPNCEKPTTSDKKFCPDCGAKLPEQTVAEGAVCVKCGKQNAVGTKFCQDCGEKLPAAVAEEQAQADRNAAVMLEWEAKLPQYPKWTCGGTEVCIDDYGSHVIFCATFDGNAQAAYRAVEQYRQVLLANGFRQAGEYPCTEHLYKRVDGIVYHVDTEHCFDGDPDCASVGFDRSEPRGGFDYVKPEPTKKPSLRDLLGI